MLAHPLASPAAAEDWTGSCPLWFVLGEEQIADAARLLAQTAHSHGVSVTLTEYEKLPHSFFWMFQQAPQTRKVMADWARVIIAFAKGRVPTSSATFVHAKGLMAESMDIERLVTYTVADARELMWQKTLGYHVPDFHKEGRSKL
jgi:hypothetical protein